MSNIIRGFKKADSLGADVINVSWGVSADNQLTLQINTTGESVVIVASAGNGGQGSVGYPARLDTVIAVGATDSTDSGARAPYSAYVSGDSTKVQLVAPSGTEVQYNPGATVYTTDVSGSWAYNSGNPAKPDTAGKYYQGFSGTSAAAPVVAGVAALVKGAISNPSVAKIKQIMYSTARTYGYGKSVPIDSLGYGRVDAALAVLKAKTRTSFSSNALAYNNGRKIAHGGGLYWMCYESNGYIFTHKSTNGSTWNWNDIDVHTDYPNSKYPAIAVGSDGIPHLAFLHNNDEVIYAMKSGSSWSYYNIKDEISITSCNTSPAITIDNSDFYAAVIAFLGTSNTMQLVEFYEGAYQDDGSFTRSNMNDPTIVTFDKDDTLFYHLAWRESSSIKYKRFHTDVDNAGSAATETVSTAQNEGENPCIAVDEDNRPSITWSVTAEGGEPEDVWGYAAHRRRGSSNWESASHLGLEDEEIMEFPSLANYSNSDDQRLATFYRTGEYVYYFDHDGSDWDEDANELSGFSDTDYISTVTGSNKSSAKLVAQRDISGPLYELKLNSGAFSKQSSAALTLVNYFRTLVTELNPSNQTNAKGVLRLSVGNFNTGSNGSSSLVKFAPLNDAELTPVEQMTFSPQVFDSSDSLSFWYRIIWKSETYSEKLPDDLREQTIKVSLTENDETVTSLDINLDKLVLKDSLYIAVDTVTISLSSANGKNVVLRPEIPFTGKTTLIQTLIYGRRSLNQEKIVEKDNTLLPEKTELAANFPNPFNPVTTIKYTLKDAARVRIVVYNILGQEVVTLLDQDMPAGWHQVQWDGANSAGIPVSSGMYLYRIQAGGFIAVKKMLLVK